MRKLIFGLLALALFMGTTQVSAQKKKKTNGPITGKVFTVDPEKGFIRLIITTRNKKETNTSDALYQIEPDTEVILMTGKEKKVIMGKEGLKDVQKDDQAVVVQDADFKTVSITISGPRAPK